MQQLPLGVRLHSRATFDSFAWAGNAAAQPVLRAFADGSGAQLLTLHGPAGSGKSHLAQACCAGCPASAYLPLGLLAAQGPGVLEGADTLALLAVDELEAVVGLAPWEQALFHLYNEGLAAGVRMLFCAREPAGGLPWRLPDLRSRLQHPLALALVPLDEAQQLEVLQGEARQRGMELPTEVAHYLQRRLPRDMGSLVAALEQLDTASLAEQRRLTIPFIRQVCGLP